MTPSVSPSTLPVNCPKGYYCATYNSGIPVACNVGYYCPGNTRSRLACPWGSYCPDLAEELLDCPAGLYCPLSGIRGQVSVVGCLLAWALGV